MKSLDVAWIDKKVRWQALTAYGLFIAFAGVGFIFRNTYPIMLIGLISCSAFGFLLGLRNKIYSFCFVAILCLVLDGAAEITGLISVAITVSFISMFIYLPIIAADKTRSKKLREMAKNVVLKPEH